MTRPALLVVLLALPGVRAAFHFGAMTGIEWLVASLAGVMGVAWFEVNGTVHEGAVPPATIECATWVAAILRARSLAGGQSP